MNLEEYLAKIIKLAKKNDADLKITFDSDNDTAEITVVDSGGVDWVNWHLGKSLDEQPNKENLKSLFKGFKI